MIPEQVRQLPARVLLEEYRTLLQDPAIEALPLTVTGSSMAPFLADRRDTVYLSRLQRPARRGDLLLYQRDNGTYILHRVLRTENGCLTMLGDAQRIAEPGIRPEQVIAVVRQVERKGKRLQPGSLLWEFFAKVWIRMVPLRSAVLRLHGGCKWLLRRT